MSLLSDARILASMARGLPRRGTHADSLAGFYGPQADRYDAFRERLLHGRDVLVSRLPVVAGDHIVELGGGTGRNLDFFGPRLDAAARVDVVDLCPPLLAIAKRRLAGRKNVRVITGDATSYRPDQPVDCVYFSYALTMIPDWRAAVHNAVGMLRPGGTIGVVDFYVSEARPDAGLVRHGWLTRRGWPAWFRHDGVHLSADHLPYLRERVHTTDLREHRARLPYVPVVTVPYYVFIGRKA